MFLHDGELPYAPRLDLVDMVYDVAEFLEADRFRVEAIVDGGPYQPLSAYVVEFADEDNAAIVSAAADRRDWPDEIQVAVVVGAVCAVLRMDFRGEEPFIETLAGLERFRAGLVAAIRRS